jgi:hypothetical protein
MAALLILTLARETAKNSERACCSSFIEPSAAQHFRRKRDVDG